MPATLEKKCQMCGQTKSLSEFHHNQTKADMHNGICKLCQAEVNRRAQAEKK